jgi:hypothetical protein
MAMYSGGPFSISKKFRFCPFCGVDLDSEVGGGLARGYERNLALSDDLAKTE